jgi:hypothetical protein
MKLFFFFLKILIAKITLDFEISQLKRKIFCFEIKTK